MVGQSPIPIMLKTDITASIRKSYRSVDPLRGNSVREDYQLIFYASEPTLREFYSLD